jgi:hypothetical protein
MSKHKIENMNVFQLFFFMLAATGLVVGLMIATQKTPTTHTPSSVTDVGGSTVTTDKGSDGSWKVTVNGATCTAYPNGQLTC